MFEPSDGPRLFGLPPGADFPKEVVAGLIARLDQQPPEVMARVEVFVNTRRMQRRMKALFDEGPARLLPRIRLITDLARDATLADVPPPVPPLRRRLELTQLVAQLLDGQPDLAPRTALFDLADSLAGLMDEMQGEGVPPEVIRDLDVADQSGHWQRSLAFVNLVDRFLQTETDAPDTETRQRMVVERLVRRWQDTPPEHPVIVAGSTGSRGATAAFMRAVARLPQGAVVLPGFDFELPDPVWRMLEDPLTSEDHPQYRFARLVRDLNGDPQDVRRWEPETEPSAPRNRLVSLALRPAPVTDQWMVEGANLTALDAATEGLTLVEAQSSREEAGAIALILRDAAERGKRAALITPDRMLTRQVTAALDRWGIIPDDSAGRPLPLTAPGRLLRHVASLFGQKMTAEALLTLLKHPLTNAVSRGPHLLHTRDLELSVRRNGPPFPTGDDLRSWATKGTPERQAWADWLGRLLDGLEDVGTRSLAEHAAHHIALAEALAAGPGAEGSGRLWEEAAGVEARRWMDAVLREAEHGGVMSATDYQSLIQAVLQRGEVRESVGTHPSVMIWGTLEARVQGADVVVLGGLNEGTWPEIPRPDPWLNRQMRVAAGLLLPERQIGLAAHDFQQAVAAPEAVLTRSIRDAEAQTVPSRWLNRLTNLMEGLEGESREALARMRARGDRWCTLSRVLDSPTNTMQRPPAPRPAPRPPVEARPAELSITEIQTLIRDPYAIYARHVLGLRPLDPLRQVPDAPLRGTVLHEILETFIESGAVIDFDEARSRLMAITDSVLAKNAPWPAAQRMWRARMDRVADWLLEEEIARQAEREFVALERRGWMEFPDLSMTLKGKIDRIDRLPDGRLAIYDYKTGSPPSKDVQTHFDKQLALAAMMAEHGAVTDLGAGTVGETAYIGLGATPRIETKPWEHGDIAAVRDAFVQLIASYRDRTRGYVSRRAVDKQGFGGDYDHLARFGEWDQGDDPWPEEVGE